MLCMEYYGVIYCIACTCNNKKYIGKTKQKNHQRYFNKHLYSAYNEIKEKDRPLYRAIRKYGKHSFIFGIICYCKSKKILNQKMDFS